MIRSAAFTLAELLIALAVLGVIATFTIPKVLQGQQSQQRTSIVKETAASIASSYQLFLANGGIVSAFTDSDLTPYLNYVAQDTVTTVNYPGGTSRTCSTGWPKCLKLHNGAMLFYWPDAFCDTPPTAVHYEVDVDGTYLASNPDVVSLVLYSTGKLTSSGNLPAPTPSYTNSTPGSACTINMVAHPDPPWFNWN